MSGNISVLATRSLAAVDDWMKVAQANLTGTSRVGFRESRVMYDGGVTTIKESPTLTTDGFQIAEQTLKSGYTVLNFRQSDLVESTEDSHMAVQGEGFFLLMNQETGELFFTRDGEFHMNSGHLVNNDGLVVVDRAIAINLGLIPSATSTIPPITADELNSNNTGWQPFTGNWLPYQSGSVYDEGGTYQYQTINLRNTFFIPNSTTIGATENVTVNVDDAAYLFVNGVQVGGIMNIGATTRNIAQYLHSGANTIAVQAVEYAGGEFVSVTGTVAGINVGTGASQWAVSISPQGYTASTKSNPPASPPVAPTDYMAEFLIKDNEKGMILANTTQLEKLQYSRYGATVFEAPQLSITADCILDLAEQQGLGKVVNRTLETSNVDQAKNITEMSLLGKVYNGFVQLIKAYNSTVDDILGMIR